MMLILTRRVGEAFMIGDNIRVMLTDIRFIRGEYRALIGIEAPREIQILRTEIIRKYGPVVDTDAAPSTQPGPNQEAP